MNYYFPACKHIHAVDACQRGEKDMKSRYIKKRWIWATLITTLAFLMIWTSRSEGLQWIAPTFQEAPPSQVTPQLEPPAPPVKESPKPLSNRIVEYHISVKLNDEDKTLLGVQSFTWLNPGKQPVNELYFHLYPNAFASSKTTFMKESGGKLRNDHMKEDGYGHMTLDSMKTNDGYDLTHTLQYVQPDDGNKEDHTLVKVSLPQPVNPGERVSLMMNYTVKLPYAFARMGYAGDFIMAGQWFPKVAVYEPVGTRDRTDEGWNLHQYHGNSEFYADFGIYNVKITVPASYTVAATGFPTKPATTDKITKTYHFYADDVHDFAWAASPQFIYHEEPFSAQNVPGVKIKLYLDPNHKTLKDRYMIAAKKALAKYSEWFGPYPYSTLSVVVPPAEANGAGGMEYPSLVTGWGADQDTMDYELERVIVHEIGHQFWYGMVASNEFEEAWLDEGFTSYAEDLIMESEYGVKANLAMESSYITSPAPLKQLSWDYRDHNHYADNVYVRAKLVLVGIEKQIGRDQMKKVLSTYFHRWKFKHPSTKDFQQTVEDVTRKKWDDYFNQFVYGGTMSDYAVESISSEKISVNGETAYENVVLIQKRGGHYASVPIYFHFSDGTVKKEEWAGTEPSIRYTVTHTAAIDWVSIDPGRSLVLENKKINNFLQTTLDNKVSTRWNLGVIKFVEILLNGIAL